MKRVLIAAGGTGGHIFPGLAVAERLRQGGVEVFWLGTENGMENRLVGPMYSMARISITGLRGMGLLTWLAAPWRLCRAIFQSYRIVCRVRPDVVLGLGGFVSGPGCVAAFIARVPIVIHEQNARAGTTNRLLSHIANRVLCAFPGSFMRSVNATVVGNPVREAFAKLPGPEQRFGQRVLPLRILVLGGSRGAHAINQTVMTALLEFSGRDQLQIWHQTGEQDADRVSEGYANVDSAHRATPFIEDAWEAYVWADLVICRAGALTVSELAMAGVASILIPYPYATDDHQFYNAKQLESVNAAVVLRQADFTAACLIDLWETFLRAPEKMHQMSIAAKLLAAPQATTQLVAACQQVAK